MRTASVILLIGALAGCATAPQESRRGSDTATYFPGPLVNCPTHGHALPPAGPDRVILGYSSAAWVRGQQIARAPAAGCLSAGFGLKADGKGMHYGIDVFTRAPAPVYAAADGVVVEARMRGAYGLTVLIRHRNGVTTRYAHLSELAWGVEEGASVRAGEMIGATGATGNARGVHLHYEIRIDGEPVNPLTVGR